MHFFRLSLLTLFIIPSSFAINKPSSLVFTIDGNIYYSQNNQKIQITHSGKNADPVLSPDKTIIAFTRAGNSLIPSGCPETDSKYGKQIWLYEINSKKERVLVLNNFSCSSPEKQIIDPNNLQFSPDSKKLYFLTSAWTTSAALHVIDINGTNPRFLIPANSSEVVSKGQYKGYLIVNQHRYFIGGGSYDWYWLFSPAGKEAGPFGETISEDQRKFVTED